MGPIVHYNKKLIRHSNLSDNKFIFSPDLIKLISFSLSRTAQPLFSNSTKKSKNLID